MHNLLVRCRPHGVDLCNQVFTILGPDIDSIASAQGNWPWNIQQYYSKSQNVNVNERYLSKTRFQLHAPLIGETLLEAMFSIDERTFRTSFMPNS